MRDAGLVAKPLAQLEGFRAFGFGLIEMAQHQQLSRIPSEQQPGS